MALSPFLSKGSGGLPNNLVVEDAMLVVPDSAGGGFLLGVFGLVAGTGGGFVGVDVFPLGFPCGIDDAGWVGVGTVVVCEGPGVWVWGRGTAGAFPLVVVEIGGVGSELVSAGGSWELGCSGLPCSVLG